MLKSVAGLCAAVMLATTSSAALAQSQIWRISETAGAVSVRRGTEIKPAARNAVLAPGDAVVTGPGARAVLVHDRDFVTVSANSRVSVPLVQEATGFTRIVQDIGNAIFRIEKLKVPHFAVKTPYLAAVVKGTTFSVTVDGSGTSLQVVEGVVEVATLDGGAKDLIRPGAVATIGAADLYRLQVQGDGARTIDSPARPADAPAATGAVAPAAAVSVASAPMPSEVPAETGAAEPIGFEVGAQTIGEAISSKPIDLASITGGMMTGTTAAAPAMLVASVKLENTAPAPAAPTAQPPAPATPVVDMPPAAPPVTTLPAAIPSGADAGVKAGAIVGKPADDAKTVSDDLAKEPDKLAQAPATNADAAVKDAEKAADNASAVAAKAAEDAKINADNAAREAAKSAADDAARQAANNAADAAAREANIAADNAAREAAKNAADNAAREAAKNAADDAAREAVKNAADNAAREAAKNASDNAAREAANEAAKNAEDAKQAADDAAKDAANNAANEAARAAEEARQAADDAAKSAAKAAQDALDAAAELAKAALDKLQRDDD
ncbi:FecR domain-containing protein [uncultured Sphingomonas sp.]|uniref:FecR domain-containing protein n=1 Tax=uncultured Sphingomonas sp. TaxID=158754 RepID=UPI0035CAD5F3